MENVWFGATGKKLKHGFLRLSDTSDMSCVNEVTCTVKVWTQLMSDESFFFCLVVFFLNKDPMVLSLKMNQYSRFSHAAN